MIARQEDGGPGEGCGVLSPVLLGYFGRTLGHPRVKSWGNSLSVQEQGAGNPFTNWHGEGKVQQKWGLYGRSYGRQLYGQDGGHLGELGWVRTV